MSFSERYECGTNIVFGQRLGPLKFYTVITIPVPMA